MTIIIGAIVRHAAGGGGVDVRGHRDTSGGLQARVQPPTTEDMPHPAVIALTVAIAVATAWPTAASPDGPYEPNETAATATVALTAPRIDAGLETP
jgi:hypothetical protein